MDMTASIIRFGSEQQVFADKNLYYFDPQSAPMSVTGLADGGWVLTWQEFREIDKADIYQQRFRADGTPVNEPVKLNDSLSYTTSLPKVTALPLGGWIVAWESRSRQDDSGYGIYQRRYDADGIESDGAEQRVTTANGFYEQDPGITAFDDGGWVVTWTSSMAGGVIFQQRYNASGNKDGGEIRVSTPDFSASNSSVAVLPDGGWVVTWVSSNQDGSEAGVYQQFYNSTGTPSEKGVQRVNTYVTHLQEAPSITVLADGGWVLTWHSFEQEGKSYEVYQQRYDQFGEALGSETRVNTYTANSQLNPSVMALADGGWVVTWHSLNQDGSSYGVYQQRYDADGNAHGPEQRVNETTDARQWFSQVTALGGEGAQDGWVVTWLSGGDSNNYKLYQQRYDLVPAFIDGQELELGTGTEGNDLFEVMDGGLNAGDTLEAGNGIDILRMIEPGRIDLTAPDVLTGLEIVQGSGGNDIVVTDAARLAGVVGIQGHAGRDALHLKAGAYDLTAKFISGFESIVLLGTDSITFGDKATALLANSQSKDGAITLTGDTFTLAERQQLYAQGIRQVTDAKGVHILAPSVPDLKGASVQENAAAGTAIGELSAQDPNPGDGLRFDLVDTAGGRFALEGSKLVVAAGARLDYEQSATHSIVVRVTDDGGIAHDRSFTIQVGDVDVERIYGTAGKDALTGTGGREILYGFMGKDTLTGGTGQDTFVFDSRPHKTRNADTITDFNVNDDGIWLENKVFAKLGKKGTEMNPAQLKKSFFTIGDKAKDQNDYIVYNKAKGVLYYDADGSGSRYKQVEIATLSKKLKMTHKDFFVI
jgi:hypothetical protein